MFKTKENCFVAGIVFTVAVILTFCLIDSYLSLRRSVRDLGDYKRVVQVCAKEAHSQTEPTYFTFVDCLKYDRTNQ